MSSKFSEDTVEGENKMAERNDEGAEKEKNLVDTSPKTEETENLSHEDSKDDDKSEENQIPSQQQEEEVIKRKYGGLLPKKPPLISKDNERAFFDSADWALGKVGAQKSKGPLEALRPKLEPTPHQQIRSRSPYSRSDDCEYGLHSDDLSPVEIEDSASDGHIESHGTSPGENQISQK